MKRTGLMIAALGFFLFAQVAQADWTANKRLTWNSGDSLFSAIAADSSGYLHVLWGDWTPGNAEIFYKKSTDAGYTWSTSKNLSRNSGESGWPAIAVDALDNLHVFWEDDTPGKSEIYYIKSTDGGTTWSEGRILSSTSGDSWNAAVTVDSSGNLHAVWNDDTPGNHEIYYKKSTDGGTTWSAAKRLTWNSGSSWGPVIAPDLTGVLFVVWFDKTYGNYEILYRKSTDGGATWSTSKSLTWNTGDSCEPVIAVDPSDHLHMVWYDYTPGNSEIYYKRGTASSVPTKRLTWTSGESRFPDIAVDPSGYLHLVWWDNTPGNAEIFYKETLDKGVTWSISQRLTSNSGDSYCPSITADPSDNLHVIWHDNTPGNYEIYYKKFIK